jgi:hypothetical protein
MEELWMLVEQFPNYMVSNAGRIMNPEKGLILKPALVNGGDLKINLTHAGNKYTRSVRKLVATAWCPGRSDIFDSVITLDNIKTNVHSKNLMWRPHWFAWEYANQFTRIFPQAYYDQPVRNLSTDVRYESIVECGMCEGILFIDIMQTIQSGESMFPNWHYFSWD